MVNVLSYPKHSSDHVSQKDAEVPAVLSATRPLVQMWICCQLASGLLLHREPSSTCMQNY